MSSLFVLTTCTSVSAQEPGPCAKALVALDSTQAPIPDEDVACFALAAFVVDKMTEQDYIRDLYDRSMDGAITPRDLQSSTPQGAATGGTPAQDEAVPGVQPLALAGGSLAAVGNRAGTNAMTALTFNPSIFTYSLDNREDVATYSRLTDLTLLFPVTSSDQDTNGRVDYVGIRARINVTSLSQGSKIMQAARAAFGNLVQKETDLANEIATLLSTSPDPEACAKALIAGNFDGNECGGTLSITLNSQEYQTFKEQLQKAREEADAFYYGLNIGFDFGDPSLGEIPGSSGTGIFGGFAIGKRFFNTPLASAGLRAHLGARYFDQDNYFDSTGTEVVGENDLSFEGAFGFELSRSTEQQSIRLASGFEARYGNPPEGMNNIFQTNYLLFRTSLNVPITASNSITLNVGIPVAGEVNSIFSINGNWNLLLPDEE